MEIVAIMGIAAAVAMMQQRAPAAPLGPASTAATSVTLASGASGTAGVASPGTAAVGLVTTSQAPTPSQPVATQYYYRQYGQYGAATQRAVTPPEVVSVPAPVFAASTLAPTLAPQAPQAAAYQATVWTPQPTAFTPQATAFAPQATLAAQAAPQATLAAQAAPQATLAAQAAQAARATRARAPMYSETSVVAAGATTRFLYTRDEGVTIPSGAERKELARYPDHVLFKLREQPMLQRPDFLMHVTIDSDRLDRLRSAGAGDVTIAKLMVEENDAGDPSIFYREGKVYATQQHNDRTTQLASLTIGGEIEIVYVSDQTRKTAYLRARGESFDVTVGAKCGGVWATGSNDKGKIHVMVHACVSRAAFVWSDTGLGDSVARAACVSSV
jgi:hypothetical protein